jgi:hypothetical protein
MGHLSIGLYGLLILLGCALGAHAASKRLRHTSLQSNADYYVKLNNYNNVQYSAPLALGSQQLPVIYDTGSFEILVLSKLCPKCEAKHSVYDQQLSSSFAEVKPNIITEHLFGSGPVVSQKGLETIRVGGTQSSYGASSMPFWQVMRHGISVWDENAHFSGIVGLGHPTRIPENYAARGPRDITLLAAMQVGSFGFCLQRGTPAAPGWLIFGPTVEAMPKTGTMFKPIDVVGQSHWGVAMYNFYVPGIPGNNPCVPSCGAIIDSGTSLIAAPPAALPIVRHLTSMVKSDCSNIHLLPTLKFRLGNQDVELPPNAYVMRIKKQVTVSKSFLDQVFSPQTAVQERCVAGFMTLNKNSDHGPVWILGMPFLRYYYTIFDRIGKKIYLSESTPSCQPSAAWGLFVNATQGLNHTGAAGVSSRFSPTDFEANDVDPNGVRVPSWALESGNASMLF